MYYVGSDPAKKSFLRIKKAGEDHITSSLNFKHHSVRQANLVFTIIQFVWVLSLSIFIQSISTTKPQFETPILCEMKSGSEYYLYIGNKLCNFHADIKQENW